ncbi:DUF2142 domain-containing protein [Candidatus Kirkpatrickella diaphorinae]|uniref:DUF2142 domain-containing protein n=1 Tax=Candidatus Kirkpatrickella diaphorinae TaxID=2984322 RepID=A0ABY6GIJ2_9PROT|nr:DUF2142 domain-containing protein [Candidatus Kirkpatrickella diaphorinae]UYH51341.1 DUF2142 domain-containing protein [Candidatus Kirkpatrickella diaphorinae]
MKRIISTSRPLYHNCRKTAIIYLLIGLSAILGNIWFSPISVIPDEPNHFARALQISEGKFYSKRVAPTDSGGDFPAEMMRVLHAYDDINFHAEKRITPELLTYAKQNGWGGPVEYFGIANTAVNPPWSYPGVVVGIWLGKIFHFSVFTTFMLARALTGLLAVTLTAFAIALCRRGTLFLVALASMPMTLHLFASCSQDALLISAAFMAAALLTRQGLDEPPSWALICGAGLCFAAFVGKPPMLVFAILPLLITPLIWFWRWFVSLAIPFVVSIGWALTGIRWGKAAYESSAGMSEHGQIQFLLHHPLQFPGTMLRTFYLQGQHLSEQFIGVLGWLDTFLPRAFYVASVLFALILLTFYLPKVRQAAHERRRVVMTLAVMVCATILVCISLYIIWTIVGQDEIIGLQGRYFIPIAAFLIVAMRPDTALMAARPARYRLWNVVTVGYALSSTVTMAWSLDVRYWP